MLLLVFLLSALMALAVAPTSRRLAVRLGAEDHPTLARKVHFRKTPRLGGVAIAAGTVVAVLVAVLLGSEGGERIIEFPRPVLGLALAGLVIGAVGLIDDVLALSPWIQLGGELLAAWIAWSVGFRIEVIELGFASWSLGPLALPVTLLWMLAAMNALNLIDGLDGLAATMALLALVPLAVQALSTAGPVAGIVAVALAGAVAGFLVHNVNPAHQFMGSSGSLLLGLILSSLAIGTLRGRVGMNPVLPLLALGVPLLDTALAIARRTLRGQSPLRADRGHLHHRLLDRGFSGGQAVIVLAVVQGGFSLLATVSLWLPERWVALPLVPAAGLAGLVCVWLGSSNLVRRNGCDIAERPG
ncbi:MAG: undecaprenyl/decaprenyl-phosphate alpha-N-acetylglucosaminyl 1-phosphate transferase [Acidobacteriota bacterium]|nr:MAG: undecaprenyl/decaprenyl-phosphate alpha-N-acetylglucosaminyl 1-phosphate transferase [Acidobacteriota bacterium]